MVETKIYSSDDLRAFIKQAVDEALKGYILQKAPEAEPKYMTGPEVCERLRISSMTLYNHSIKGNVKKYRVGRRTLYKEAEIEGLLKSDVPLKYRRK